jgi:hypothetical protein
LILLDENILESQRLLLESSRIRARQIGVDFGHKGLKDEEIIVLIHRQRRVTFFTRDAGFYMPGLRHPSYCLIVMSVSQSEVAAFVRRFLSHPDFHTQALRMGRVVRLSHAGMAVWQWGKPGKFHHPWPPSVER